MKLYYEIKHAEKCMEIKAAFAAIVETEDDLRTIRGVHLLALGLPTESGVVGEGYVHVDATPPAGVSGQFALIKLDAKIPYDYGQTPVINYYFAPRPRKDARGNIMRGHKGKVLREVGPYWSEYSLPPVISVGLNVNTGTSIEYLQRTFSPDHVWFGKGAEMQEAHKAEATKYIHATKAYHMLSGASSTHVDEILAEAMWEETAADLADAITTNWGVRHG